MDNRVPPSRPAPPPPVPAPASRSTPPDRPLPPLPPPTAAPEVVSVTPPRVSSLADTAAAVDEKAPVASDDTAPAKPKPTPTDTNPFHVDLVIPFSVAPGANRAPAPIAAAYHRLVEALEGEGGLRVTARPGRAGKGAEEVWVFVGASDSKVAELVARERLLDHAHGMLPPKTDGSKWPSTRLRLLYDLLTSPQLQNGLGITPGEGDWERVKGIVALHDDAADNAWVERWATADWKVGLLSGLSSSDEDILARNQSPALRLYFNFLVTYTLSLMPIAVISVGFWLYTPADSYPPLYAFALSLYSAVWLAVWRIKERKLAVQWGTRGCENVAVGRLRPQYVSAHNLKTVAEAQNKTDVVRDAKVVASVPVILACGGVLALVLTGIFMLEAFVGHLWHGAGKAIVPLIPTALFSIVVPQVVGIFNGLSKKLVGWEDHPTPVAAQKSLTVKTFAMNGIVAYLGLFLSALVYLPFGPYVMSYVGNLLAGYQGHAAVVDDVHVQRSHPEINVSRLKSQVFTYLVTNQVINTFLEAGLPFILRFIADWRAGKASVSDILHKRSESVGETETESELEKNFLDKVERELALPDYTTFVDYAEMVTQFGYVVTWSVVWPLAPVFALVNNYFEIRSDALKVCKHVRRPIGDRVETIGTWLDTMGIIAWVGGWMSATLIALFRPHLVAAVTGVKANGMEEYNNTPTLQDVLPTVLPIVAVALAASHGYLALRWAVDTVAERLLWNGSAEDLEEQSARQLEAEDGLDEAVNNLHAQAQSDPSSKRYPETQAGFWTGPDEGADEIARVLKTE
ncbi:hypothetical protein VHUM_02127 [Vanrija humicola]|uniref:Uncharacterized protein n=1 Tax=Vanrija humicola TaxID=5417 RepID=A0A7D8Z9N7_VANHU|nr:hypothetical protein VHUM_02127 [Vanrija humicola]